MDGKAAVGVAAGRAVEEKGQHEDAHEFLAVLGAMHERHAAGAENLAAGKKAFREGAACVAEQKHDQAGDQEPAAETEYGGNTQPDQDLAPLLPVDRAEPVA